MVDCVRVPNQSTFRFFQGRPDLLTEVEWYRVPWDRETLGLLTAFGSSIWDDVKQDQPLGEINKRNRWSRGAPPLIQLAGPPGRCGKPEQWLHGVQVGDPAPDINPNTGAPVCCPNVVIQCEGGVIEGVDPQLGAMADAEAAAANTCFVPIVTLPEADGMQAQVCWHAWDELPEADALAALVSPPPVSAELPEAEQLDIVGSPPPASADLPEADDLVVKSSPPPASADLPEAEDLDGVSSPPPASADLPEADDLVVKSSPPPVSAELPEAEQLDVITTSGGGGVSPGLSCVAAATITLPFTQTQALTAGTVQWWKFTGVAGTRYHLRITLNSGTVASGTLATGACPTPTNNVLFGGPYPNCGSFLLPSSGTVFVKITADAALPGNYSVEVATGLC